MVMIFRLPTVYIDLNAWRVMIYCLCALVLILDRIQIRAVQ